MLKTPATAGSHHPVSAVHATPLTGVVIGIGISMMLWAMILAIFFAVR